MDKNQQRIQKWAAKRQAQTLKQRLDAYEHPLDPDVLNTSKQLLLRAKQRNKESPWQFVLPQQPTTEANSNVTQSVNAQQEDSQAMLRERDNLKWLNTVDDQPLTMQDQLKGKFLIVDFWTSCCINCIHVLAELEELEAKFKDFPEVAFIGVHSAKFDKEEAAHILRQAIIRYDVKHPCINDCKFDVWNTFKLNNWPTLILVGPDGMIIQKLTEERNVDSLEHVLFQGLRMHQEKLERQLASERIPELLLSSNRLPIKLEKDKAAELRQRQKELGLTDDGFTNEETITALRQNLSQPGKLIVVNSAKSPTLDGELIDVPLPYENVTQILVIADSSNNRILVLDASNHTFLEQIGTGRNSYKEGSFTEAEFSLPQGLCHYIDAEGFHCLMVCDVKNHLVREINLHSKQVKHVAGIKGVRGCDTVGGEKIPTEQELASPWDIVLSPTTGEFLIAMAGTHQIWSLDIKNTNRCKRISGSGAEGNANERPESTTWAQPSGLSIGRFNGESSLFVADSESSAVRAFSLDTEMASNVAGANDDASDLFDFGDSDGVGFAAKLQHPLGVHYCEANQTLYVADTYNHKIKEMRQEGRGEELTSTTPLVNWVGATNESTAKVLDGAAGTARLNEPNGCWAKVSDEGEFLGLYIADTGNDCIRFASADDGRVETLELQGVPDVRNTASDCLGGQCGGDFDFGDSSDEEEKKQE